MAGNHAYIALPPDGSGKQVPQSVMIEVDYDTGTIDFTLGDVVSFSTSTWIGTIIELEGVTASGTINIRVEHPVPSVVTLSATENIIVNAVTNAKVNSFSSPYYFQQIVNVGRNMTNQQEIDDLGNSHVRFEEGSPRFDAFGKLETSQQTVLGDYIHTYDLDTKNFFIEETTGGTVTHIGGNQGLLLTNTTTTGSRAATTSHLYHKYQLGTAQIVEVTVAIGDTGKANVDRVWGYGDAADGLFFAQQGDTALQVFMRSSTIGDSRINQAAWNKDRLDGNGGEFNPSGETLDITKDNIYWIDFQWLGAGRVRFGVVIAGVRTVCHEMHHANKFSLPYIRTGSLPVCLEQINTGTASSSSEMRAWCQVVKTGGDFTPTVSEHYHHIRAGEKQNGGIYMAAITNWHPGKALFSIRPSIAINTITNRTVAYPIRLSATNLGSSSMFVQARRNATLLGTPTWVAFHDESSLEYCEDVDLDQDNRGVQVGMWAIPPNSTENISLTDVFGYRKERIMLGANGTDQASFQYTFTCWNMSPIAGGSDAGTYTCDVDTGTNTITKTAGTSFLTANHDGVAFSNGQMIKLRNSTSDDGYYILTNVTATVLTVEAIDGTAVSFTGSTTDVVTIQGGTKTNFFGNINVEEIW